MDRTGLRRLLASLVSNEELVTRRLRTLPQCMRRRKSQRTPLIPHSSMAQPTHFLSLRLQRSTTSHSSMESLSEAVQRKRSPTLITTTSTFKLKSLNTGEEIDIRDENNTGFVSKLARMLTLDGGSATGLQTYL